MIGLGEGLRGGVGFSRVIFCFYELIIGRLGSRMGLVLGLGWVLIGFLSFFRLVYFAGFREEEDFGVYIIAARGR